MTTARSPVRYVVAVGSFLVAVLYLLIGVNVITVVDDQGPELVPPMLISGVLFAVLAILTILSFRPLIWMAGAGLQVLVIVGYVAISSERTPAFEVWGILVKVVQAGLLVAFGYLMFRSPRSHLPSGRLVA